MLLFLTAITLGFLGSFHCIGMCGPIALALPLNNNSTASKLTGAMVYNSGRIITYALLGGFFGIAGQGFVLAGYQQALSIILGITILIIVLLPARFFSQIPLFFLYGTISKLKSKLSQLFQKKNYQSLFSIGILNGLLPCGLVYLGVAGSVATGNSFNGSLFMAAFGLGTLPTMFTFSIFSSTISIRFRNMIRKSIPAFVGAMGILLILRGMNLGIPYISPEIAGKTVIQKVCCHK